MQLFEDNTCVFIIRIWFEPRSIEGAAELWRGTIIHIPTGKRRYVKDLGDITTFMRPYLEERKANMGTVDQYDNNYGND